MTVKTRHFRSAAAFAAHAGAAPVPASSGNTTATAWPAVATANLTVLCSPSPWSRCRRRRAA